MTHRKGSCLACVTACVLLDRVKAYLCITSTRESTKRLARLGTKVFGLIHFIYLANGLVMSICAVLVGRRLFLERNEMTMVFTSFILCYPSLCFLYFGRGLFDQLSYESVMIYKCAMLVTVITPALLADFLLYPLFAKQRWTRIPKVAVTLLTAIWCLTALSGFMMLFGTSTVAYTFDSFDVYSTTFWLASYLVILSVPISVGLIDVFVIGFMYARERESFFKRRSLLLLIGWLLTLLGQMSLISLETLPLNPFLTIVGIAMMSLTILRRAAPQRPV